MKNYQEFLKVGKYNPEWEKSISWNSEWQMIELDKNIKTVVITVFNMYKELED